MNEYQESGWRILLLSPIALTFLVSCGQVQKAKILDTTLPSPAQPSQAVLGKGYNTKHGNGAKACQVKTKIFSKRVRHIRAPNFSI